MEEFIETIRKREKYFLSRSERIEFIVAEQMLWVFLIDNKYNKINAEQIEVEYAREDNALFMLNKLYEKRKPSNKTKQL